MLYYLRIKLFLLLLVLADMSIAQDDRIPPRLKSALEYADIPESSVSLIIHPLDRHDPMIAVNPKVPRNPASTVKLLTTYAALDMLTPAYRWKTEFFLEGELLDGTLKGNLGIKGYGDPFMVLEDFWQLLRELRRKGIDKIEGDLILDDSYFAVINEDMSAFDNQPARTYNLPPNALMVNFQTVRFIFNDKDGAIDLYMDPDLPNLRVENRLKNKRGGCFGYNAGIAIEVKNSPARDLVAIDGLHPVGCEDYSLSRTVLEPGSYFYGLFKKMWEDMGGQLQGSYRSEALDIAEDEEPFMVWRSRSFKEVLTSTNKFSNNTMTRHLLLTLAAEHRSVPATTEDGIDVIEEFLQQHGMDTANTHIENGSGLSRKVRVDAQLIMDTLLEAYQSPNAAEFIASLPINGVDGTMRRRTRGESSAGMAHIKTGRLDHVIAMAGILQSRDNKRYALVFIINHEDVHRGTGVDIGDLLLDWLYNYRNSS